jgi:hypothetical protein
MPSFILRGLDPDFWRRVQTKAQAENVTIKEVILRLLSAWLGVVLLVVGALLAAHCDPAPTQATTTPPLISATAPTQLTVGATPGQGATAGHAVLVARVQNGLGGALTNITVGFTTTLGALSAPSAITGQDGTATLQLTASAAATVTATVGTLTAQTLVASEPTPPSPLPSVPSVPPPPAPPAPTPTPPSPSYVVSLTASSTSPLVNTPIQLTASATAMNGAPAPTGYAFDCNGMGFGASTAVTTQMCSYASAGTVTAAVRVTGGTVTGSGSVSVTAATAIPVVTVMCTADPMLMGHCIVSATLGGTQVESTLITSVTWDFGDGVAVKATSSNLSPEHTFPEAGLYNVVVSNVTVVGATGPGSGTTTITASP